MPTIHVDGQAIEARAGVNVLQACLSAGLDLPYFCWHPDLGSVGACRQCAIVAYRDANDQRGRLVMGCMTDVAEGARFSIAAREAESFRASVIEWLMLNHPHDCPVCEEGGECHLQDMTVMTGHTSRRYAGRKRTFRNQYLGPFLNHEMNRCIACYRCVRFYRDYAGGSDLQAFGSRDRMFFGRAEDGVLENPFAGNLVEVCPTGVFTDKPFSQVYTRKWDLQSAPSVCSGCGVGCNTIASERYGVLKRIHNRYHADVNGYFLCDRGRFGSGFVNSARRMKQAGVRRDDGSFDAIEAHAAVEKLGSILRAGRVVGIGSPRASLESNFALRRLVGNAAYSIGVADDEHALLADIVASQAGRRTPTVSDVEQADAVLVLGEDVLNTAPRIALALRQAVRNRSFELATQARIPQWQDAGIRGHGQHAKSPLFLATPTGTDIDDIATRTLVALPEAIADVGQRIAAALAGGTGGSTGDATGAFVAAAAAALRGAKRPLVVSGTGARSRAVIAAANAVASALSGTGAAVSLLHVVPEANSEGVALLGGGTSLTQALEAAAAGSALVVLENDLYRRAERSLVDRALAGASAVVVLDALESPTAERASLVLPAATFAESEGTFVNYEARAQRFYQVFIPTGDVRPAWRWLADAAVSAGRNDFAFAHVDDVIAACAGTGPQLSGVAGAGPDATYRAGFGLRVPRMTHRASGRTAMNAHVSVHEPKTPEDTESPLAYSMEGLLDPKARLAAYVWSPGWNSNQSITRFQQEVSGPLQGGSPGVVLDVVAPALPALPPAAAAAPAGGALRLLPLYAVFGSDELSMASPPVAERAPRPFALLHPDDAAALGVGAGHGVRSRDGSFRAAVRVDARMHRGAAGYVAGLQGGMAPAAATLERDPEFSPDTVIARG
jgi:NADH-quinone oxidoreductase subunit G